MPEPLKFIVAPGIGDIAWLYSKFVTLGLPIHFVIGHSNIPRSHPFLELLPGVTFEYSPDLTTKEILPGGGHADWTMAELIERATEKPIFMQCNHHLENGHRIETFIEDMGIDHHFPINIPDEHVAQVTEELKGWDNYVVFYCANPGVVTAWGGWQAPKWTELAKALTNRYSLDGIVIIGAEYDLPISNEVAESLPCFKNLAGKLPVGASLDVIRRSKYMVGFPSGMPILATMMSKPVFMFYPDHLEGMHYSFADPALIESGSYKAAAFCEPKVVIDWIAAHDWLEPKNMLESGKDGYVPAEAFKQRTIDELIPHNDKHRDLFLRDAVGIRNFCYEVLPHLIREIGGMRQTRIIDLGCGFGRLEPLLTAFDCVEYLGIDGEAERIRLASERDEAGDLPWWYKRSAEAGKATFKVADILGYGSHFKYDIVFSAYVMQHLLMDDKVAMAYIMKALRADKGVIVLCEEEIYEGKSTEEVNRLYADPNHAPHMIPICFEQLQGIFHPLKFEKVGPHTYIAKE